RRAHPPRALQADRERYVARRARSAAGRADRSLRPAAAADEDLVRDHVAQAPRAAARRRKAAGRRDRRHAALRRAGDRRPGAADRPRRGVSGALQARRPVQAEIHVARRLRGGSAPRSGEAAEAARCGDARDGRRGLNGRCARAFGLRAPFERGRRGRGYNRLMNDRPMNAQRPGRLGLSLATALLGIALASAAFGQAPSSAASEPPLYRVEVIVFAHNRGNPAEEDFAYIARRESMSGARTRGRGEIAQFDFGPYLPEEGVSGEPSGLRNAEGSARSRLLLGQNEAADGADQTTPRAGAANEPADAALPDTTDAADADTTDPASADGGQAAEGEAGTAFDPFGGDPGNAVAAFRFRLLEPSELELGAVRQRLARGYT